MSEQRDRVAKLLRHAAETPVLSPNSVESNESERINAWEEAVDGLLTLARDEAVDDRKQGKIAQCGQVTLHCVVCGHKQVEPEYHDARCHECGQRYEYNGGGLVIVLRPDQVHLLCRHWMTKGA